MRLWESGYKAQQLVVITSYNNHGRDKPNQKRTFFNERVTLFGLIPLSCVLSGYLKMATKRRRGCISVEK